MHNALFLSLSLSVTSRESLELTQASYNYLSPRVVVTSVCLPLLPVPSRDRRIRTLCKSHPSQGVTARRDGMRKSIRTRHAREYCVSTRGETRALAALEVEEDGSTSRSTRQTENDPIITPCLHNDTPFGSYRREREGGREREREEAERERYPKNQPNRPRWHPKTPGGNHHRRFHARRRSRGANCATIWFTSNERKTTPLAGSGTGRTDGRANGEKEEGGRRSCVDTVSVMTNIFSYLYY